MRLYMGTLALLALTTACTNRCYDPGEVVVSQSYVHKYGVEVDPQGWNERGGHGQVVSNQKNGVTVKQNFSDGILDGETTYTFPHSSAIQKVVIYEKGNVLSETINYPAGGKKMMTEYTPSRPEYLIISQWYENGNQRSRETYSHDRMDEGTYYDYQGNVESTIANGSGNRYERDDLGHLLSSDKYENGELVETTFYHLNKTHKEVIPYANGQIQGLRKYYNIGGDPDRFEEWQNGRHTGTTTIFQHGEKVSEMPYVNGIKNGVEKRYRDGEYVVEEVTWVNNRRHGPHTLYVRDEKTVDWFFNDSPVSKVQFEKMSGPYKR